MANRTRPGPLTAIAIVALALGGLGTCVSSFGLVAQAGQDAIQDFQRTQFEAAGGEQARLQIEMQEHVQAAVEPYMPFSITHQILNLFASLALLGAGVLLLRWNPNAPAIFTGVALANLALDIAGGTLGMLVQLATSDAMQTYMRSAATAGTEQVMGAVAEASAGMGVCTAIAMFLLKAGYYIFGIVWLRKPQNRALFEPEAEAPGASAGVSDA